MYHHRSPLARPHSAPDRQVLRREGDCGQDGHGHVSLRQRHWLPHAGTAHLGAACRPQRRAARIASRAAGLQSRARQGWHLDLARDLDMLHTVVSFVVGRQRRSQASPSHHLGSSATCCRGPPSVTAMEYQAGGDPPEKCAFAQRACYSSLSSLPPFPTFPTKSSPLRAPFYSSAIYLPL